MNDSKTPQCQTLSNVKNDRIRKWKELRESNNPGFAYEQDSDSNTIKTDLDKKDLTKNQAAELHRAIMCAATGSAGEEYSQLLFHQAINACFITRPHDPAFIANAINVALIAMKPADEIEGMLCTRLLVLHNQYMTFMNRSCYPEQSTEGIDININRASKLMRVYNETLEALNRHRRKGEQKVIVQHVNVENGGKAVVSGEFNAGGGVNG